jgi:predicted short-subunit dehydrogenase-like oxidoreductase (DUF2520 family)
MRELERDSSRDEPDCTRLAIIGPGRLGTALAAAFRGVRDDGSRDDGIRDDSVRDDGGRRRYQVIGPLARGADGAGADAVLLCVPDQEIGTAAATIATGPAVGHCSGATGLDPLAQHVDAFSLHPLMTVTHGGARFEGAGAAIAGSSPRALALAAELATALGMHPVEIAEQDRPVYHAAASVASNFLVTLEAAAERLAAEAGVRRELLVPLARATVENWAALGSERALTGPVARGDEATVSRQRAALEQRAADLLPLFDALVEATRALASRGPEAASTVVLEAQPA